MADVTINATTRRPSSSDTDEADRKPVLLRYPTIELKTSFESLLSHSTSSSGTERMSRPSVPPPDLDESWASLDASEFSHDDDRSENAETGSLVDLSSNHDTESAVEDDTQSEINVDEDQVDSVVVCGTSQADDQTKIEKTDEQDDEAMEDTVILQRSLIQDQPDAVNLEYTRSLSSSRVHGQAMKQNLVEEKIHMTVSKQPLKLSAQPFSVAFYGIGSTHETKDELLGKIGAALVVASSASNSKISPASPTFNIIPTEFGPGSKPAFADLIPSQAQMTVEDLTVLRSTPQNLNGIRFGFKRGVVFESEPLQPFGEYENDPWKPDLVIILVSRDDAAEDYCTVKEVFELARRHHWPTITVTKEQINGLCPPSSCYGITVTQEVEVDNVLEKIVQPIDLDSFVAIDTDQLNRHLNYLKQRSHRSQIRDSIRAELSPMQKIRKFMKISLPQSAEQPFTRNIYNLRMIEPAPKKDQLSRSPPSLFENVKQYWSTIEARRMFKDIFLTFTVMLLATYILSFSHGLTKPRTRTITAGSGLRGSSCTATVTATSSIPTTSATNVPSIEHDVMVYDPITFDQVWNRLTGRPAAEQQQKIEPETEQKKTEQATSGAVKDSKQDLVDSVQNLFNSIKDVLNPISEDEQPREKIQKEPSRGHRFSEMFAQRKKLRAEKQAQIKEMHEKMSQLWSEVSKNVKDLGKQSQEHFDDLVSRSHRHLRRARWAGEKKLEKLVREQKRLLSRAQNQATSLTHDVPQRKKRGCSGCRKFW